MSLKYAIYPRFTTKVSILKLNLTERANQSLRRGHDRDDAMMMTMPLSLTQWQHACRRVDADVHTDSDLLRFYSSYAIILVVHQHASESRCGF